MAGDGAASDPVIAKSGPPKHSLRRIGRVLIRERRARIDPSVQGMALVPAGAAGA